MKSVIFVTGAFMCALPLCSTPHNTEPASAHAIQPAMPYTAENLLGVDKDAQKPAFSPQGSQNRKTHSQK